MPAIRLLPLGKTIEAESGGLLQDALFEHGIEFPCGGQGRCKGCRVKVIEGNLPASAADRELLSEKELADGWRLACQAKAEGDLVIEAAQWEAAILADDTRFSFVAGSGLGVAVDLGTTTIAAQLVDLSSGAVLAVRTGWNAQARHGADIMSRLEFALREGPQPLARLIREQIDGMISAMLAGREDAAALRDVVIVGNTAMHHLFCGIGIEPLAFDPFEPGDGGMQSFSGDSLGWERIGGATVRFLPCLGGFVGSDLLAGILAVRLHESAEPMALIDLGTNGEIVIGSRDRILCCSTAAGPAFEGARISMGMRAAAGAISAVEAREGRLRCHVLGHTEPRGLCGSGLVDAAAACLDLGLLLPSGRLPGGESVALAGPVALSQCDVRELQLAKGAIAAGIELLADQWGTTLSGICSANLAGAFGNYISIASARRIGLLAFPPEKIRPAGNTALLGAKMALFDLARGDFSCLDLPGRVRHVPLNEHPGFQDAFVRHMAFPSAVEP